MDIDVRPYGRGEQILHDEGVKFIRTRTWIVKQLFKLANKVDPDVTLAISHYLAEQTFKDENPQIRYTKATTRRGEVMIWKEQAEFWQDLENILTNVLETHELLGRRRPRGNRRIELMFDHFWRMLGLRK